MWDYRTPLHSDVLGKQNCPLLGLAHRISAELQVISRLYQKTLWRSRDDVKICTYCNIFDLHHFHQHNLFQKQKLLWLLNDNENYRMPLHIDNLGTQDRPPVEFAHRISFELQLTPTFFMQQYWTNLRITHHNTLDLHRLHQHNPFEKESTSCFSLINRNEITEFHRT